MKRINENNNDNYNIVIVKKQYKLTDYYNKLKSDNDESVKKSMNDYNKNFAENNNNKNNSNNIIQSINISPREVWNNEWLTIDKEHSQIALYSNQEIEKCEEYDKFIEYYKRQEELVKKIFYMLQNWKLVLEQVKEEAEEQVKENVEENVEEEEQINNSDIEDSEEKNAKIFNDSEKELKIDTNKYFNDENKNNLEEQKIKFKMSIVEWKEKRKSTKILIQDIISKYKMQKKILIAIQNGVSRWLTINVDKKNQYEQKEIDNANEIVKEFLEQDKN